MDGAVRNAIRTSLVVTLVVVALSIGYVVRGGGDASTHRPVAAPVVTKKLTVSDLLLAASTAQGIHLRYQGVTKGPLDAAHDNDIPISSFQFGVGRGISSGAGRTASPPNISEVTLTHQTDSFSLPLLNQSLRGAAPGVAASLYFTDLSGPGSTPFDFLTINLGQTLISSFTMSAGGGVPSESLAMNFVSMTFTYRVSGSSTVQRVSWNSSTGG